MQPETRSLLALVSTSLRLVAVEAAATSVLVAVEAALFQARNAAAAARR